WTHCVLARLKSATRHRRSYRWLQNRYYDGRRLLETHVVVSALQEWLWRRRSGGSESFFTETLEHPHRLFLMDRISRFAPINSVLEFGCNAGPNLDHIARRFPGARAAGVD